MKKIQYRVSNWRELQHFRDRRPPWVKLYRHLLDDVRWHRMDGVSAKGLVMLWLLASEDESRSGLLPPVDVIAFRLRMTEKQVYQLLTNLSDWLEQVDIDVISPRYQNDLPETETETETETEIDPPRTPPPGGRPAKRASRLPDDWTLPDDWSQWATTVEGLPTTEVGREAERFADHWRAQVGQRGRKSDWRATWRNWIRRAVDDRRRAAGRGNVTPLRTASDDQPHRGYFRFEPEGS